VNNVIGTPSSSSVGFECIEEIKLPPGEYLINGKNRKVDCTFIVRTSASEPKSVKIDHDTTCKAADYAVELHYLDKSQYSTAEKANVTALLALGAFRAIEYLNKEMEKKGG